VQWKDNKILVRGRSRFVGPEACKILETLFKKKEYKIMNKIYIQELIFIWNETINQNKLQI